MSGKYPRKKPSAINKKMLLILVVILCLLIVLGIIIYVILQNKDDNINVIENTEVSVNKIETFISEEPSSVYDTVPFTEPFIESTVTVSEETTEKIVVPGADNSEGSLNFNAEFTAYRAYDAIENRRVSLKEVFGSSYSGGAFVFNEDGTFCDNLSISAANYGAYVVADDEIFMTYNNDKNRLAKIISSDDYNVPSEIIINYSGYEVYFRR